MGPEGTPGWRPDPWQPGGWRWHDGEQWTSWTGPPPGPPPHLAGAAPPAAPVDVDADAGRRARPWGFLGLVALPIVQVAVAVAFAVAFDGLLAEALEVARDPSSSQADVERAVEDAADELADRGGAAAFVNLAGFVPLGLLAAAAVWTHRVAGVGRRLGYPARRSTGWAAGGWFVPVVNLWFPYQAVADSVSPANPARRSVLAWWLCLVGSWVLSLPVAMVGMFSGVGEATPYVVAAGALAVAAAALGTRVVTLVHDDHAAAAGR